jgi:hypothetical protein
MTIKLFKPTLGILLALLFVAAPAWAKERIKTDGTNRDSPIKIDDTHFQDSGYGLPGPNAEIRLSTTVRNTSKEDDLKNVTIKLQLKMAGGDVVEEWTKEIPVMKKGTVVEFDPGGVYYNYSFNNLQPSVEIEHDKPEEKKEEKKDKKD